MKTAVLFLASLFCQSVFSQSNYGEYSETKNNDDMILYAIIFMVILFISIAFTRAIFSIPKFLDYQKAQTFLLAKIARENNVSDEVIKSVLDSVRLKEKTTERNANLEPKEKSKEDLQKMLDNIGK